MGSSTHFTFPLVPVLLLLCAISDISYGHAEEKEKSYTNYSPVSQCTVLQTTDVLTGTFMNLIKEIAYNMPPETDKKWENSFMKKSEVVSKMYMNLVGELVNLNSQSTGTHDKVANAIMQATAEETSSFMNIFPQLFSLYSYESQTGTFNKALVNGIQHTTAEKTGALADVFAQLVELYSKTGTIDKSQASAVMQSTDVVTRVFTNLIKLLTYMPLPCTGVDKSWASAIMQTTAVFNKNFRSSVTQLACIPPSTTEIGKACEAKRIALAHTDAFNLLAKDLLIMALPSAKNDSTRANAVAKSANVVCILYNSLLGQLVNLALESTDCDKGLASSVMKGVDKQIRSYTELFRLLSLLYSGRSQICDEELLKKIQHATAETNQDLMNVFVLLAKLYSKTGAVNTPWPRAVMRTVDALEGYFTLMVKQFTYIPPPSVGVYQSWASGVLETIDVMLGIFRNSLIKQFACNPPFETRTEKCCFGPWRESECFYQVQKQHSSVSFSKAVPTA